MKSLKEVISTSTTLSKFYNMTSRNGEGEPNRCITCKSPLLLKDGREFCFRCEVIQLEDKQIGDEYQEIHNRLQITKQTDKFKQYSLINAKLQKAHFDNYEPLSEEQAAARKLAMDYAKNFSVEEPKPLFFYGPYGTGKSHLAKSITDVVMEQDKTCLFFSVEKLLMKIRSTWRDSDMTEFEFMDLLAKVDLLVLDDLGSERTTTEENKLSWATSMFFSIVNSRAGKHTVITMNYTIKEMIKVYGERDASRLLEDAVLIHVPGTNYRLRQFKKGDGSS